MNKWIAYFTLGSTILMLIGPYFIFRYVGYHFEDGPEMLIEPAKYAFMIWFIIQAGFIALGVYQALPKHWDNPKFMEARFYINLNVYSNLSWLIAIGLLNYWVPLICSVAILYSLYKLSNLLGLGKPSKNLKEQFIVKFPIAIYFGWMTIIVPITFTMFFVSSLEFSVAPYVNSEISTILILVISFFAVVYLFLHQKVNLSFLLSVLWGLIAIFFGTLDKSQNVAFTALGLSIGLILTYFIVERQQMEMSKIQMELTALRNQVNPHFLFNNLNTLANLIPLESEPAHNYLDKLAKFYRYTVSQRDKHLVSLREELNGVEYYISILKERFGENLSIQIDCTNGKQKSIPALSLQMLIENAVKHNVISADQKLHIHIYTTHDNNHLEVQNNINERIHVLESTGMGLDNIRQRYRHFTKKKINIQASTDRFSVTLPLMEMEYANINN